MEQLKNDYKNAVFSGNRKYNMSNNGDGTVSLDDVTTYDVEGDRVGAEDLNNITGAINSMIGVKNVTIPASGWSSTAPYTQTISVAGVVSSDSPIIGLNLASSTNARNINKAYACIDKAVTSDGSITFYCYIKRPSVDIPILVKGV